MIPSHTRNAQNEHIDRQKNTARKSPLSDGKRIIIIDSKTNQCLGMAIKYISTFVIQVLLTPKQGRKERAIADQTLEMEPNYSYTNTIVYNNKHIFI